MYKSLKVDYKNDHKYNAKTMFSVHWHTEHGNLHIAENNRTLEDWFNTFLEISFSNLFIGDPNRNYQSVQHKKIHDVYNTRMVET